MEPCDGTSVAWKEPYCDCTKVFCNQTSKIVRAVAACTFRPGTSLKLKLRLRAAGLLFIRRTAMTDCRASRPDSGLYQYCSAGNLLVAYSQHVHCDDARKSSHSSHSRSLQEQSALFEKKEKNEGSQTATYMHSLSALGVPQWQ